jgi:hypothetical protein
MWGSDNFFPMNIYFASLVFASVAVGMPLSLVTEAGPGLKYAMQMPHLNGVILSTLG